MRDQRLLDSSYCQSFPCFPPCRSSTVELKRGLSFPQVQSDNGFESQWESVGALTAYASAAATNAICGINEIAK